MNSLELNALKNARALLVACGWCQQQAVDMNGSRCISQAIFEAAGRNVTLHERTCAVLRSSMPVTAHVVDYNDNYAKTLEGDVLPIFDRAIELAEAAEMYQELEQSSLAQANAEQGEPVREVITLSTSVETVA